MNLLLNAEQSMKSGGIIMLTAETIDINSTAKVPLKPGKYIRINVQDYGCGISNDVQDKIFDPYFTTKSTGSGLGLTTSFSIIRRHGGYLTFESEENKGSTFYAYLPVSGEKSNLSAKHQPFKSIMLHRKSAFGG